MKGIRKLHLLSIIVALMMFLGVAAAQAKLVPKVDNFIIFPDQSGSMYMTHQALGEVKMALAKKVLLDMNEIIPELGYQGSIYLFAPFQQVAAPAVYERARFGEDLNKIKDDQEIYGRRTPMGTGIMQLDSVLAGMQGKTAIIMLSDGKENMCTNPVMEAKAIHDKYPDVCFHVISFAEDAEGKAILKQINEMGSCCNAEGSELLKDKAAMEEFVRCVFYDEVPDEEVIVLRGIHFDFDKYNIKPEWEPVLKEGSEILRSHPEINVIIEGHTDSMGTVEYNQRLSERRAGTVRNYFVGKGIAGNRMKTKGYSELRPMADNATDEGRALNRRVEIQVVQ